MTINTHIMNTTYVADAKVVHEEILNDVSDWFSPTAGHKIFDQAYMKFINRNLNYFDFGNMVTQTTEPPEYNPSLVKTLEFCLRVKDNFQEEGPFGRMCVWKIPPKMKIMQHVDNFEYHRHITRYIFSVSEHSDLAEIVISGKRIDVEQGSIFKFYPAVQRHRFYNMSDVDWYFLGFDFWKTDLLKLAYDRIDSASIISNPARLSGFGCDQEKYQSFH